jgi:SAM-dependent methyltransferase
MKFVHKLGKLVQPLAYRRAWRRAQRSIFRLPFGPVLANVDQNRLREIQNRYAGSSQQYAKYADIDQWLRVNRERVQDLKLHRSQPKRVLDLGCGGGFFLFILKPFGHSVLGLDVDESPLFADLLDVFSVPRVVWRIKPFEPLPNLRKPFDWITAFSISFDRYHPSRQRWGEAEWDFLLHDMQRQLAPNGKIYLGLNPMPNGDYYTPQLRDFFIKRGAEVEKERIFFESGLRS